MCYRTKLNAKLQDIERSFNANFIEPETYSPVEEINAFDFRKTPVITDENRGKMEMFHWGLIPFWAKDDKLKNATLNARIETATEKPAFRNSAQNRCLIIADAYYEWQWLDSKGKQKQKYQINPKHQEVFAFAGIYSNWRNLQTNELVHSYSVLTTEANELMSKIHNNKRRMPVVLRKEDRNNWLSGKDISQFAFPYEVELEAKMV